ncbi:DUF397 domain-containing protein [Actinomadura sp. DSM 109109]|nr:DUF397 domain-containing protein [Actinomadura lepetitiana]
MTSVGHIPSWRRSSRSLGGTDCVETALMGDVVGIRDSKDASGPLIAITTDRWRVLSEQIKRGRHDVP